MNTEHILKVIGEEDNKEARRVVGKLVKRGFVPPNKLRDAKILATYQEEMAGTYGWLETAIKCDVGKSTVYRVLKRYRKMM